MPARQPGARPPGGSRTASARTPARVRSHATTEFEFHMSPSPSSSRPQTWTEPPRPAGAAVVPARGHRRAAAGWTRRTGPGMTPSRHLRTSYRNIRSRPRAGHPTGPSTTTPREAPSASGIGHAYRSMPDSLRDRTSAPRETRRPPSRSAPVHPCARLRSPGGPGSPGGPVSSRAVRPTTGPSIVSATPRTSRMEEQSDRDEGVTPLELFCWITETDAVNLSRAARPRRRGPVSANHPFGVMPAHAT